MTVTTSTDKRKTNRRDGMYWLPGPSSLVEIPYISVTTILKVIDKSQPLMYWFGGLVYDSVLAGYAVDGEIISREDAMKAPYAVNVQAKSRGTDVHKEIVENFGRVD